MLTNCKACVILRLPVYVIRFSTKKRFREIVLKKKPIRITDAEWELMCVLWDAGVPCPPDEIYKKLQGKMNCTTRTMRTHLDRLVRKGGLVPVKSDKFPRACSYYVPGIDREAATEFRKKSVLKEFFGTAISSMLTAFIQNGEMSKNELRELKNIIDSEISKTDLTQKESVKKDKKE